MDDLTVSLQSDEFGPAWNEPDDRAETLAALNRALDAIRDYREERAWIDRQITFDRTV